MKKRKIILFCLLAVFGFALFAYGISFHATNILPQKTDDFTILASSESALIKEVSIGGVKRDESGDIRKTYTGKAPTACDT